MRFEPIWLELDSFPELRSRGSQSELAMAHDEMALVHTGVMVGMDKTTLSGTKRKPSEAIASSQTWTMWRFRVVSAFDRCRTSANHLALAVCPQWSLWTYHVSRNWPLHGSHEAAGEDVQTGGMVGHALMTTVALLRPDSWQTLPWLCLWLTCDGIGELRVSPASLGIFKFVASVPLRFAHTRLKDRLSTALWIRNMSHCATCGTRFLFCSSS